MGYCLLDFALPSQDLPQVMMSVEVARLVLQRLLVMRSRLFELPLFCENVGQVVASDRVFGVIDIVTSILRAPDNTPVPLVNPER